MEHQDRVIQRLGVIQNRVEVQQRAYGAVAFAASREFVRFGTALRGSRHHFMQRREVGRDGGNLRLGLVVDIHGPCPQVHVVIEKARGTATPAATAPLDVRQRALVLLDPHRQAGDGQAQRISLPVRCRNNVVPTRRLRRGSIPTR